MRRDLRRHSRGMTLIELLLAILILAIGLIASAQLMLLAAQLNTRARDTQTAVDVATRRIEEIRSRPYDLIVDEEFTENVASRSPVHVAVDVSLHPTYESVKVVKLEATWDERSKGSLVLDTLVSRDE